MTFTVSTNTGKRASRPHQNNQSSQNGTVREERSLKKSKGSNDSYNHDDDLDQTGETFQQGHRAITSSNTKRNNSNMVAVVNVTTNNSNIQPTNILSSSHTSSVLCDRSISTNERSSITNEDEHLPNEGIIDSILTPKTMESSITSNSKTYQNWRDEHGGIIMLESKKQQVRRYVRDTLFTKVKFITADKELDFSGKNHFFAVMIFNLFCLLVSPFMLKWLCCIQERSPLHLLFVMTTKLNPTAGKNIEKLLEKKLKTKGLLPIQH